MSRRLLTAVLWLALSGLSANATGFSDMLARAGYCVGVLDEFAVRAIPSMPEKCAQATESARELCTALSEAQASIQKRRTRYATYVALHVSAGSDARVVALAAIISQGRTDGAQLVSTGSRFCLDACIESEAHCKSCLEKIDPALAKAQACVVGADNLPF